MAEKKKMSVADILAAARKADADQESATTESNEPSADVTDAPPSSDAAPPKPGERPSVAEMIAMAKAGGKPAETKPATPAPKKAAKEKPKAAGKTKPTAAKPAKRPDTASILAAARGDTKLGPMTKAEAAEKAPATTAKAKAKKTGPKPSPPSMPERPAYAVPQPPAEKPDGGRRLVVFATLFGTGLAAGMTFLAATVGVWTLALARFMFPNILTEPPSKFTVGFPGNFAMGQVETKFKAQYGVWVVHYEFNGQPMIYALSTVCTHLGCTPNWLEAEQKFKCPCHGSGFYKDGVNFEGPAPRPLERYAIRIADDGQVEIDKSRKFQEEIGQWEDPASSVLT